MPAPQKNGIFARRGWILYNFLSVRTFKVLNHLSSTELKSCIDCLNGGGLICYPTETFYAIGVDPSNANARKKVYELKGRNAEKNLPLIAGDLEMIQRLCDVSHPSFEALSRRFWPGPLTLVLAGQGSKETYAVRISSHPVARQISQAFGRPIVSTSANESGKAPLRHPKQLPGDMEEKIDVLIDAGPCSGTAPSTIVSLLETDPRILREGIIATEEILLALL